MTIGGVLFTLMIGMTISGHLPYASLFRVHPLGRDAMPAYYFLS